MHTGIYSPLEEDAVSESRAAAQGGVTSSLNYFRSGQYYLNKGGPYHDFFPEVLRRSQGRFHVDYGYHLAPMDATHIREIPELVERHGVASFKIFMFYGSHGLHGRSDSQRDFLMIGPEDRYDFAHFEFVMRGVQAARERFPANAAQISLSLHCETAEIMTAYTKRVESEGRLQGLAAYQALGQYLKPLDRIAIVSPGLRARVQSGGSLARPDCRHVAIEGVEAFQETEVQRHGPDQRGCTPLSVPARQAAEGDEKVGRPPARGRTAEDVQTIADLQFLQIAKMAVELSKRRIRAFIRRDTAIFVQAA